MSDFFRERTAALKLVLDNRREYRLRYYRSECAWDSRHGGVERSEEEKIVEVSPSEIGFGVVTTGDGLYRWLYHVKPCGESWSIHEVDTECGHQRIFGASYECGQCGGTGWVGWKVNTECSKRREQPAARTTRPSRDAEPVWSPHRDSAIEQFMRDHFRERTAALQKEAHIYGDYVKQFYGAECDWTRWVVSAESSEAERIVSIVPVDTGAQVTTDGFGWSEHQLRYHLRPAGQSWLIWEVDLECSFCVLLGRTANCTWCGGTGWDSAKAKNARTRDKLPGEEPPPDRPRWKLE